VSFLILCVLTVGGLAWYVLEPHERTEIVRAVLARVRRGLELVLRLRRQPGPLHDVLHARTRFALVTAALAAANLAVYIGLRCWGVPSDDPAILVSWGASYGPKTTNGEWWRLLTATFIHRAFLDLVVNLAALISIGVVLERLVGHFTFAAVYLASAMLAGLATLAGSPASIVAGGAAAIFGLHGLLLASWAWGAMQQATTTIRLRTVTRLIPVSAAFVVYHAAGTGRLQPAEQIGLVTGFACGLALARSVRESKPPARRTAGVMAVTAMIAIVTAIPLRGMADIRPQMDQLVALEARLGRAYDAEVNEFTQGRVPRTALVRLIEGSILPEFAGARSRMAAIERVPADHQPLLAAARAYVRLRDESWRLRASALRQSSTRMLREADRIEREALQALRSLKKERGPATGAQADVR
jgi:membrane associated rhomboid family serine protease